MFESETFSDFELISKDGKVLKAHKAVLASRSPVFFSMLNIDMEEAERGSVNVPDVDKKTLKELLRFIYCNEVEGLNEISRKLIFAAEKYELKSLKTLCM